MIEYWWPTPVFIDSLPFGADGIEALLKHTIERFEYSEKNPPQYETPQVGIKIQPHTNMFSEENEKTAPPEWFQFKRWVDHVYRQYLAETTGMRNVADLKVVARAIPAHFTEDGRRTMPHYHHTADHVMVVYLDCGSNRKDAKDRNWRVGDGELILQDPRPMASFPYWEKIKMIETHAGKVVMHPSRVWHESNGFHADGARTLLALTLRVESHNYVDLYKPL
jgi:hypothetical protein